MIKYFIPLLIIFLAKTSYSQESIRFKSEISSNKKYTTRVTNSSSSEIFVVADDATIQKMESNGVEFPIIMEQETDISMVTLTGQKLENGDIPVLMEYGNLVTKTYLNGKSTIDEKPYSGMKILGRYDTQNKFVFDTIIGNNVTDPMKKL